MEEFQTMTLANGKEYLLIKKFDFENETYFAANGIKPDFKDEDDFIKGDVIFLQEVRKDDKLYADIVKDEEKIKALSLVAYQDTLVEDDPSLLKDVVKLYQEYFNSQLKGGSN